MGDLHGYTRSPVYFGGKEVINIKENSSTQSLKRIFPRDCVVEGRNYLGSMNEVDTNF